MFANLRAICVRLTRAVGGLWLVCAAVACSAGPLAVEAPAVTVYPMPTRLPSATLVPATVAPIPTMAPSPTTLPASATPPLPTATRPAPAATRVPPTAMLPAPTATRPAPTPVPLAALPTAPPIKPTAQPTRIPVQALRLAPINTPAASGVDAATFRAQLLASHNQGRAENGLPPLTTNALLQQTAQQHAEDLARSGRGSHVGSDGSTLKVRLARNGITTWFVGENWAYARSNAEAWKMWYTDEYPNGGHRLNILRDGYRQVGFGIASGPPYSQFGLVYIVTNFSD